MREHKHFPLNAEFSWTRTSLRYSWKPFHRGNPTIHSNVNDAITKKLSHTFTEASTILAAGFDQFDLGTSRIRIHVRDCMTLLCAAKPRQCSAMDFYLGCQHDSRLIFSKGQQIGKNHYRTFLTWQCKNFGDKVFCSIHGFAILQRAIFFAILFMLGIRVGLVLSMVGSCPEGSGFETSFYQSFTDALPFQ